MVAYRKNRKYVPKRYRKRNPVSKAVSNAKKSAFDKKVLKVIRKQNETKMAFHVQDLTSFNSGINSSGDAVQVIPSITNGTGDSQRIGDQIRMTKFTIQGYLQMKSLSDANNFANRKIAVRLMVVKPKRYGTLSDTQNGYTQWQTVLLKKGSTTVGFTGVMSDLWAPLNTEVVTKLYDKVYYMTQPALISTGTGLAPVDQTDTTRLFKISIPACNRLLKYDLNNDNGLLPVGENWVLCCGYVHMDNSSPDTVTTQVALGFDTTLLFEDA